MRLSPLSLRGRPPGHLRGRVPRSTGYPGRHRRPPPPIAQQLPFAGDKTLGSLAARRAESGWAGFFRTGVSHRRHHRQNDAVAIIPDGCDIPCVFGPSRRQIPDHSHHMWVRIMLAHNGAETRRCAMASVIGQVHVRRAELTAQHEMDNSTVTCWYPTDCSHRNHRHGSASTVGRNSAPPGRERNSGTSSKLLPAQPFRQSGDW